MSDNIENSRTIEDLSIFVEYFKSKELTDQLVDWIYEELGIQKIVARIVVKKLAPWVLERAYDATKSLGESALISLHKNFTKKFEIYRVLTTDILSVLKARVGNSLADKERLTQRRIMVQKALEDPSLAVNLWREQKIFGSLDPDQQAYVALMASYVSFDQQLKAVTRLLFPTLRLDRKEPRTVRQFSVGWLEYRQRKSDFFGRDEELTQLLDFFKGITRFQWWVVTGEGGVGKSRLALEAMRELPSEWEWGFVDSQKLINFNWQRWDVENPTVITVDYAANNPKEVAHLLSTLSLRQNEFCFNVRVLLIERVAGEKSWLDEIAGLGNSEKRDRAISCYCEKPLRVTGLNFEDQRKTLQSYLKTTSAFDIEVPNDADFLSYLNSLSGSGRPIFIGMIAAALASGGADKIRQWDRTQLLRFVYAHEKEVWKGLCPDAKLRESALDLILIATASGGVSNADESCKSFDIIKNYNLDVVPLSGPASLMSGHNDWCLQPDIFGEFSLSVEWNLETFDPAFIKTKNLLLCSLNVSSNRTVSTIVRAASDFPYEKFYYRWLDIIGNDDCKPYLASQIYSEIIAAFGEQLQFEAFDEALHNYEKFLRKFQRNINIIRQFLDICRYVAHINYIEERWNEHDIAFNILSSVQIDNENDKYINEIYSTAAFNAVQRFEYQDITDKMILIFNKLFYLSIKFPDSNKIITNYLMSTSMVMSHYLLINDFDRYDKLSDERIILAINNKLYSIASCFLYEAYFNYANRKKLDKVQEILKIARNYYEKIKSESIDLILSSDMTDPPKIPPAPCKVKWAPSPKK